METGPKYCVGDVVYLPSARNLLMTVVGVEQAKHLNKRWIYHVFWETEKRKLSEAHIPEDALIRRR